MNNKKGKSKIFLYLKHVSLQARDLYTNAIISDESFVQAYAYTYKYAGNKNSYDYVKPLRFVRSHKCIKDFLC